MPSTRVERILAAVGLAIAAALAGLAVPAWLDYRTSETAEAVAVPAAPARATAAPPRETTVSEEPPVTTAAVVTHADVRLVAARGDCWLDVRAGSADGRVLFAGILEQGGSRRFEGRALWIEIGAPAALDVTLNGGAVDGLPQTPTTVVATASRLRPVEA